MAAAAVAITAMVIALAARGRVIPPTASVSAPAISRATPPPEPGENQAAFVWPVEQRASSTLYSNGLEIRSEFATTSRARGYHTFSRVSLERSEEEFSTPAGIVFHTTESLLLPLDPAEARNLLRTRENLIHHVRAGMLYNFVIDRFGQVFRVVPEEQVAFHAGHSVWADSERIYEGLNESFIGVAFETKTVKVAEAAQIRAGRLLTEYLRSRYPIKEADCVTHAQVSVNPGNMRIGFHTDWAADFPFEQLGLHQGYLAAVPAVAFFGFKFDQEFLSAIGGQPWPGLAAADASVRREAEARGESTERYRQFLQARYRRIRSHAGASDTNPTSDRT